MEITLGQTEVSLLNPPNDGTVIENGVVFHIGRNHEGMIVLRQTDGIISACHPDFFNGMDMQGFCWWINSKL